MLFAVMLGGGLLAQATPLLPAPDNLTALAGRWTCTTDKGASTVQNYELDRDTVALTMHVVPAMGNAYDLHESYRWDAPAGRWIVDSTPQTITHMTGSAPPWSGDTWTVEGTLRTQPSLPAEELRYTRTPDGFTREFFVQQNGDWVSTSRSTCTR